MGVTVVFDHPRRHAGARIGARAVGASGVLLAGVGLVLCTVSVVGALALLGALVVGVLPAQVVDALPARVAALGSDRPADLVPALVGVVLALLVGWAVIRLGLAVLRRGRRAVLFLRRFGFDEATRAVTAATRALGRAWRLVTLDDSAVEPVGVRRSSAFRISQGAVRVAGGVLGFGVLLAVVAAGRWLDRAGRLSDTQGQLPLPDPFGWRESQGSSAELMLALAWLFAAPLLFWLALGLLRLVTLPARTFAHRVDRAATAAGALAEERVSTVEEIAGVAATVEQMKRRVFSPQLMVVRSDNAVWHETVQRLLLSTEVTLVDVSRPTESLLWEIGELTATDDGRCVFVGDYERLARFVPGVARDLPEGWPVYHYDPTSAGPEAVVGQILRLLDGREVLAYGHGRDALVRFSRALRGRLPEAASTPAVTRARPVSG
jgi:hypothetical protein